MSIKEIKQYRAALLIKYGVHNLRWAVAEVGLLRAGALLRETFGRQAIE